MEARKKVDLDAPLVNLGPDARLSLRACCEGIFITGGIGSGKTSGSFSLILRNLFRSGFGGLLLTVKPQEAEEYRKLCIEAGREADLIEIKPGGEHSFNWLEYESKAIDGDRPITENVLEVLKTCIKAGSEKDAGKTDEGFWQAALDQLIGHVIDLSILAYGSVTLDRLYHIVQSLPKPQSDQLATENLGSEPTAFTKAWNVARENVDAKRHKWHSEVQEKEGEIKLTRAEYEERLFEAVPEARLLDFLFEFFFDSFKHLSQRTRSIIEFTFSGFLYSLMREPVYSLFSKKPSTVTPEDCYRNNKIVLINLPVKKYHETGRNVQLMIKYIFQRAWERRVIDDYSPLLFLAADEAYTFCHEHDALFQATARSSRVCTVAVSQNLSNYYAAMGGEKSKYRVNSLISTLATKIMHANTDRETNEYGSSLVGEEFRIDPSINSSIGKNNVSSGDGMSIKLQKIYRPERFVSLACGGPKNSNIVEAIIHKQGDPIIGDKNYGLIKFKQQTNNQ